MRMWLPLVVSGAYGREPATTLADGDGSAGPDDSWPANCAPRLQNFRHRRRRYTPDYDDIPSAILDFLTAKMHNSKMIDWNDLRHLLAVAREGSTAAAARTLRVNQSTVVRRVAALEKALGLRLFDKKRDGYRLTSEGVVLVEEATAVEAAVLTLTRRASSLDSALTGLLRVTLPEGMALGFIQPLLNAFHRQYRGIQVKLMIEDRYRDLGDGHADVALRAGPPGDDTLVGRKLTDAAWAVYGSRDYVDRCGIPACPEDLNSHRLIGFEDSIAHITAARWLQNIAPRGEIASRSNSILGLLFAVQSGFGLAMLPCLIGDPEADLVRVFDPLPELKFGLWILTHRDLHKTPKVRAFFDFMAAEIEPFRPLLLGLTRQNKSATMHPAEFDRGAGRQSRQE
jgi:DNA-binding transcriptional LysR family regulator